MTFSVHAPFGSYQGTAKFLSVHSADDQIERLGKGFTTYTQKVHASVLHKKLNCL